MGPKKQGGGLLHRPQVGHRVLPVPEEVGNAGPVAERRRFQVGIPPFDREPARPKLCMYCDPCVAGSTEITTLYADCKAAKQDAFRLL